MTKRFLKDNRGQVLYAVLVTVMFLGVLSMITMGLTLQHYHAAQQKQAHVTDYYAADAVAELIRCGAYTIVDFEKPLENQNEEIRHWGVTATVENGINIVTCSTAEIRFTIGTNEQNEKVFTSWEVSYHAKQPAE